MMKFRGILSSIRLLPGSSPHGTVLGVILFFIYFNGAALRLSIPRSSWPFFAKSAGGNNPDAISVKFVDDLSIAAKESLRKDLVINNCRQRPIT